MTITPFKKRDNAAGNHDWEGDGRSKVNGERKKKSTRQQSNKDKAGNCGKTHSRFGTELVSWKIFAGNYLQGRYFFYIYKLRITYRYMVWAGLYWQLMLLCRLGMKYNRVEMDSALKIKLFFSLSHYMLILYIFVTKKRM